MKFNPLPTLRILWRVFGKYRWHVFVLGIFGSVAAILEGIGINAVIPLISFFMGSNAALPGDFISRIIQGLFNALSIPYTFRYLLGFILCLFILRAATTSAFGFVRGYITADFLSTESQIMFRHTLFASWPFLLKQKIGHIQNTLVRDMQRTSNLLEVVSQTIQSMTGFTMYLLVAINISPLMTFYTLIGGGVLLFFVRPFLRRTRDTGAHMAAAEKDISQFLGEHIIGMKSLKAAGAEQKALTTARSILLSLRTFHIKMVLIRSINTSLFQPFSIVFISILFLLMYKTPGFSILSFGAALYLIQKIFVYLESLQSSLHSIVELVPYAEQVSSYKKNLIVATEEKHSGTKPFLFQKELNFANLSFGYKENETVLSGVDFTIKRGETAGIVGPSGAGKTSVADLLLRLFVPNQGGISVDGVSISEIPLEEWRSHIGYVSQDVFLLNTSIADNIRFYRDGLSEEDIIEAAKQANIYDTIAKLPEGFETVVGDRGVMLSGGQRQRIALARALAQKPDILILDEATSALDHESEKLIQDSIRALHGKVTVVIIAHRPSTVADADHIIVLDSGRVVEEGTPEKLMQNEESYFYKMQHSM